MSRNPYGYNSEINLISTNTTDNMKPSLKRRTVPNINEIPENTNDVKKSSEGKYPDLLSAFEKQAVKQDSSHKSPETLYKHDHIYNNTDGMKGNLNTEPDIVNTFQETSPVKEDLASKNMKLVFEKAKHEMFSDNTADDKKIPDKLSKQSIYNSIINDVDIKQMTYNLTQEFNKISKLFEDPNSFKPTEDPYGVYRGMCENCLEECTGYNQSIKSFDNLSSICRSCDCGASAHKQINFDDLSMNSLVTCIKRDILPNVSQLEDDTIMFNSFLVVFSLNSKNEKENGLKSDDVSFLINLFKEAGFKVLASEIKDFSKESEKNSDYNYNNDNHMRGQEFRQNFGQFYDLNTGSILSNKNNRLSKGGISSSFLFPKLNQKQKDFNSLFLRNRKDDRNEIDKLKLEETTFEKLRRWSNRNSFNHNVQRNRLSSSDFFTNLRKKETTKNFNQSPNRNNQLINGTNINLFSPIKRNPQYDLRNNPILCLCLSMDSNITSVSNPISSKVKSSSITNHFEKFYYILKNNQNFQNNLGNNLQLIYYSKNKLNALWDVQTVFPELLKINTNIVVVSEKPNLFSFNESTTTRNYFNEVKETAEFNQTNHSIEERNLNIGNIYNRDNFFGSFSPLSQSNNKFNTKDANRTVNNETKLMQTVYAEKTHIPLSHTVSNQFLKYFSQFKDFLIFNAISCTSSTNFDNFESLVNFSKNNITNQNESDTIYINNFLNYISYSNSYEKNSFQNRKISISLLKKINNLNNSLGFFNNLDVININGKKEQEILSNLFFKEDSTKYSRILLVFRPLTVRSGLSECILNIFKINECFVLKKKSVILSRNQIEFLYKSEFGGSTKSNSTNLVSFEDYFKLMSDSNAEIVVLSKFGILEDAKLICGNLDDYTDNINVYLQNSLSPALSHLENLEVQFEVENDLIHKDDKIKSNIYKEEVNFGLNHKNITGINLDMFFTVNSLLNLNSVFKSIIAKQLDKSSNNYESSNSLRKHLIRFSNQFNLFTYNTKHLRVDASDSFTYQDVNFFFPEFGSMQEVFILIKPDEHSKVINQTIIKTFLKMDFEVLDAVRFRMNDEEFGDLFDKHFTANTITAMDYSTAKETFTSGNETEVIRMVKPGGKDELKRIIGKENIKVLLRSKSNDKVYNDYTIRMSVNNENIQMIKDYCYLLCLSNDVEYFYQIVNKKISIIEGNYLLKHAIYVAEDEKVDMENKLNIQDKHQSDQYYMDRPSVSSYKNISQQRNSTQSQIQSRIFSKESVLMIHILNSCLKCTIGDGIRNDLLGEKVEEKLIDRYMKHYHYDSGEERLEKFVLNMFSKWKKGKKEYNKNEKYFEVLQFDDDCLNRSISFFVESNAMGFFEVRIPIIENKLFAHNEIDIATNYLYCDPSFYQELDEKFKSENSNRIGYITMETIPFFEMDEDLEYVKDLKNDSNKNTGRLKNNSNKNEDLHREKFRKFNDEWVNKNLFYLNKNHSEKDENLTYNDADKLVYNKIRENLHTIKKRIFYKTKYELCKFFYKSCTIISNYIRENSVLGKKILPDITPSNHHYRIKPDDITSEIRRIYQVEEFAGLHFIEIVSQDYIKYRDREGGNKPLDNTNKYLSYTKPSVQSSLPVFLWGRKLSEISKILQTKPDELLGDKAYEDIDNAGPIIYSIRDQKLKGVINAKYLLEYGQYLYVNILEDLRAAQAGKGLLDFKILNESQYNVLEDKLHKILSSEVFKHTRSEENLNISPVRIGENNLRIYKKMREDKIQNNQPEESPIEIDREFKNSKQLKKKQEHSTTSTEEISNKTVKLIDIFCHKSSKYHTYAAILYLIKISLKKLNRKSHLLDNNELEYDSMVDALLTGFNSTIDYDNPEANDVDNMNAYKSEYFLYCLSEIKFMLNEITVYKVKLGTLQQELRSMNINPESPAGRNLHNRNMKSKSENNAGEFKTEFKLINANISLLKNNINELSMNIEIVVSELLAYEIHHKITQKEDTKIIYLPKERYHIPMYFPEYLERDLENVKFNAVKNVRESYLMDIHKVNYLNRNREQIGMRSSAVDEGLENELIVTENKLRESRIEYKKDICIEKRKDPSKRHPNKLFAEIAKKQNML